MSSRGSSRSRVFFVEAGAAPSLRSVVEQIGGAIDAVPEGRVFVDGRRCLDAALELRAGQRVELHEARLHPPDVRIVVCSAGLVAVDKPAGISTEPDRRGGWSLIRATAAELGVPVERIHACSRLDFPVSGIVLLALDADARQRVARARARGELRRRYVGLAKRAPAPDRGSWQTPIEGRSAETRYVAVSQSGGRPAAANTPVEQSARTEGFRPAVLALEPVTGRTHQLRVHAAAAGAALLGDRAHGGPTRVVLPSGKVRALSRVYLHAAWVRLPEPGGGSCQFAAAIPTDLSELFGELGGEPGAWGRALDDSIFATE